MAAPSLIEVLENRIAPATFVNAFVVTYTDVDGDLVKVQSSKPIFQEDLLPFTFSASGEGEELRELLLKPSASGADLTIKVIETGASGDGAAKVGLIHASGVDLRSLIIEGDLERILVGDNDPAVRGIGLLHVGSLGLQTEEEPGESSNLVFGAGIVRIDGDLSGRVETPTPGNYEPDARKPGDIDRLVVGGNLTGSVTAQGFIGKVKVEGDLAGGDYTRSGSILATSIGKIVIRGSVIGATGELSGTVQAPKGIGAVAVEGDIVGGDHNRTGGFAYGSAKPSKFFLGGSLIGGSGNGSGFISAKQIDELRILGDVVGGSGEFSGMISKEQRGAGGSYGKVKIGGNLQGGSGHFSGSFFDEVRNSFVVSGSILGGSGQSSGYVLADANPEFHGEIRIRIGGDLVGGMGQGAGAVYASGRLLTANVAVGGDIRETFGTSEYHHAHAGSINGKLSQVTIAGSIFAADRPEAESQTTSYAVRAFTSIAKLKITGSIEGTSTNFLGISAGTDPVYGSGPAGGIGKMAVGGDVSFSEVSAGYFEIMSPYPNETFPFNPDARIGEVRIGGNLTASSITASIHPDEDSRFGTGDDHTYTGGVSEIRSRIASIIVGGQINGTALTGDAFAIAAQKVNSVKIGGVHVLLTSELDTIQLVPETGDVLLREHT